MVTMTPEDRIAVRRAKVKNYIEVLRAHMKDTLRVCKPPVRPRRPGTLNMEVGGRAQYFITVESFRSGIPQLEPTRRFEERRDRLFAGWGEHSFWGSERVDRVIPGSAVDFMPAIRQAGVLVSVYWVWDKTRTRMEQVKSTYVLNSERQVRFHEEPRRGDWRLHVVLSPRTTPLGKGIHHAPQPRLSA